MIIVLCILAFVGAFVVGRRSLVDGIGVVLSVGYIFGIVRANLLDPLSYFLFDAAVVGLYLAAAGSMFEPDTMRRYTSLRTWLGVMIVWTIVMLFVPIQDFFIQLVGFRGNLFLLPLMAIGALFDEGRIVRLALWLAVLNLSAFALAAVQFQVGIEPFFPRNAVTEIVYRSKDLVGNSAYRIPACFSNAHAFGGTMVRSLPWLLIAWLRPGKPMWQKTLLLSGIVATVLGVFLSSTRISAVILFILLLTFSLSPEVRGWFRVIWVGLFGGIIYVVSSEERLQRFMQLTDIDMVTDRVHGSVNYNFLELLVNYPFGNGLGGGGTSIPAFLRDRFTNPIGLENEYSRILLELGFIGLAIWLGFIVWLANRVLTRGEWRWSMATRLFAVSVICDLLLCLIGTGMMTSIPSSTLLMLHFGYLARDVPPRPKKRRPEPQREPEPKPKSP